LHGCSTGLHSQPLTVLPVLRSEVCSSATLLHTEAQEVWPPPKILTNFYRCTIERILTGCLIVWYGSCAISDRTAHQRVVRAAEIIIDTRLPTLQDFFHTRKARKTIADPSHSAHNPFNKLPSGRRYRSIKSRTSRWKNSFYLQAIRTLNTL